jgi:2-dehydro-3-deoxygalactonokinase
MMPEASVRPDWIAVDWGTSNLRVWAIAGGRPIAEARSHDGMAQLSRGDFEPALLRLIEPWLDPGRRVRVIACGMVGSRQGWTEAPYRTLPCTPLDAAALVAAPARDRRIRVWLAPGLRQMESADVMRGEETQIAGALVREPGFDGILCLPGTHTKWTHVSAGEVVSFQTFMTGELFDLLSNGSVLRHAIGEGWNDDAFAAALSEALSRPERLAARLFAIRAEGLVHGLAPAVARARLSGALIGAELAAARPYWLGQPVAIVGAAQLSTLYAKALSLQGVAARVLDGTACTLAGLASLERQVEEVVR